MQARREQAELAVLNERERQDLDADTPQADEEGVDANGGLVQTMQELMRATQMESMLTGCRDVDQYVKLNMISQGTYGIVYRCVVACISAGKSLLECW